MVTRRLSAIVVIVALTIASVVGGSEMAQAVPDSPGGLVATQAGQGAVHFAWDAAPSASAYRVQVATDSSFQSTAIIATQKTYALDWISQSALSTAAGRTLYWRVAAYGTGQQDATLGPDSAYAQLSVDPLAAPESQSPGSTGRPTSLTYPDVTRFSWSPVAGAVSYSLEYSSGELGSSDGLTVAQDVTSTSFTPTAPLARKSNGTLITWSWRVRANFYNGTTSSTPQIAGPFSSTRYFTISWLAAPQNLKPVDGISTVYSDVKLTWDSVAGASSYRVDIGKDKTTDGSGVSAPLTSTSVVVGTTYVPTSALVDGTFYWQVTPLDVNSVPGVPSSVLEFKKGWGSQTEASTASFTTTYPVPVTTTSAVQSVSIDDFVVAWNPVPRATLYKVEVKPVGGGTTLTCRTASTSATIIADEISGAQVPGKLVGADTCLWNDTASKRIQVGVTYRWRVQAIDYSGDATTSLQSNDPVGVVVSEWSDQEDGVSARERSITVTAPASNNATTTTLDMVSFNSDIAHGGQPAPMLSWSPVAFPNGAFVTGYEVRFYDNSSRTSEIAEVRTPSTHLRVNGVLSDNTTSQPYYASVRPLYNSTTASLIKDDELVYFGNASEQMFSWSKSSTPVAIPASPVTTSPDGTVLLSWSPQFGSGPYDGGSRGYFLAISKAGTLVGSAKVEYPFYVAQNPTTKKPLSEGSYTYTVAPLDANGQPGQTSVAQSFTIAAPAPTSASSTVSGASVALSWVSSAPAAKFQVQYRLVSNPTWTTLPSLTQTGATLADLAQGQYLWHVNSIDTAANASQSTADVAFTVGSGTVALGTADAASLPLTERVLSWTAVADASRYLVQLSTTSSMASTLDFETIGTSFAVPDLRTAGTSYYWRVRALPAIATTASTRPVLAESAVRSFSILSTPAAPTISTLALSGSTLTASWTALTGANAGTTTPIQYVIQYRAKTASDDWTGASSSTTTPGQVNFVASGLPNTTTFQFRLAGLNSQGQGPWSAVKEATTAAPPTAAPTSAKLTPGLGGLTVSWGSVTGTGTGGLALSGYTVRYRPSGPYGWSSVSTASTSVALTGLAETTSYDIEIAAVNPIGEGPAAAVSGSTLGLPSTPPALSAVRGDKSITVGWAAPATDGGSPITGYTLNQRMYDAKTKVWGPWSATSVTVVPVARTGLINGNTYEFTVASKTKIGVSATSAPISVTPAGPPTASTKPIKVTAKKGKFVIKWSAATANGSAVTGYIVQYGTNGKKWTTLKTTKASARSYTTTKGKKGKTYYFHVIPKNALGKGTASASLTAKRK